MAPTSDGLRTALHTTARVQPGNKIEITAPELKEGQDVDVFLIPRPRQPNRVGLSSNSWIRCLPARGVRRPGMSSSGGSRRSGMHGIVESRGARWGELLPKHSRVLLCSGIRGGRPV
jgi:hypothetical protein